MSSGSRQTVLSAAVLAASVAAVAWLTVRAGAAPPAGPTHLAVPAAAAAGTFSASPDRLRVCADPNNLPFSNDRGEGFENRLAEVAARELRRTLTYVWQPQRRGFVRTTLGAGACDAIMGVPAAFERVRTTRPYYRSSYVFVSRRGERRPVRSLDDPRLHRLQIGIPIVGDDYDNPPAAQALAARQITDNVHGYPVYGDYSQPDPPRGLIDAVADGTVDVAIAWGPLAGYFARRAAVPLTVTPIAGDPGGPPFTFAIAIGVARGDAALARELDAVLTRRAGEIRQLLQDYGVPLVGRPDEDAVLTASRRAP